MKAWIERTAEYIDQLEALVEQIDEQFQITQVDTTKVDATAVGEATIKLREGLVALEQKVADRDQLLRADDVPSRGTTLIEILTQSKEPMLAKRADQVAQQIGLTHQRAMSLFVCQFHLSNLTGDLVRIMTGADAPATYGGEKNAPLAPQGGLFNEAA